GSTGGDASESIDPSALAGTVTYWDTSDATNEAPVFQELIAGFQRQYPNITVDYVNVPFAEAQQRFKTAAQAGEGPDVMRADVGWTTEFATLGYLQPLSETPLAAGQKDFLPAAWSSNEFDDELWGVPQVTDAPALLCNKALLTKAGVAVPKTWTDVKTGAAAVTGAGATFLYGPTGGFFTLPYVYSQGGDMLDSEVKKVLINDPESVAGFQTALDLIASGASVKPDPADPYNPQQKLFKEGKVACIINGPWSIPDLLTGPSFTDPANLVVNVIPNGAETGASPIGGHNYVVYAASPDKAASYLFIDYMNSQASQVTLAEKLGLLPTREAAYPEVATSASPRAALVTAFEPVMAAAKERPWIPEQGLALNALDQQWSQMYTGAVTAQQGADNIAAAWLKFLPKDYTD
ncbi:MAG: arabinogalactan oligomer / maltooligosaccharide transport system substrate-binding protein, partial [Actinomycetota bacterium]|nr:arabinogalactan oligomer / maltooligosaccharide transport system substrate-binding protein [Actinomycetota bacterium]